VADLGCIAASTRPLLANFTLGRPWSMLLLERTCSVVWAPPSAGTSKIGGDLIELGAWRPR
jgi:hypothetical protein